MPCVTLNGNFVLSLGVDVYRYPLRTGTGTGVHRCKLHQREFLICSLELSSGLNINKKMLVSLQSQQ